MREADVAAGVAYLHGDQCIAVREVQFVAEHAHCAVLHVAVGLDEGGIAVGVVGARELSVVDIKTAPEVVQGFDHL